MAFLVASKKTQVAIYDFANDPSAGAIGTVDLLVYFPPNSLVTRCAAITYTSPIGPGGAIIGAILAVTGSPLVPPANIVVAQAVGAYVAGQAIEGVDLNANPLLLPPLLTFSIQMTIAVAPITAGKIAFEVDYTEIAI
jgi:hypothetical protein